MASFVLCKEVVLFGGFKVPFDYREENFGTSSCVLCRESVLVSECPCFRVSLFQSVHYLRFHCMYVHVVLYTTLCIVCVMCMFSMCSMYCVYLCPASTHFYALADNEHRTQLPMEASKVCTYVCVCRNTSVLYAIGLLLYTD